MKNLSNALQAALAVSAMITLTGSYAHAASVIAVDVNSQSISFEGAPPIEVQGAVLVPLRGVFEALGATVNYDAPSKTITANKGMDNVVLQLGSTIASVNGQTQMLSQAARTVDGTTLVPLRFVAQALGATVAWNESTSTVQIYTPEPHLSSLPSPAGSGEVMGQVTGVYTNTNPPQITLRVRGQNTSVPVSNDTIVLRSEPGRPGTQVDLSSIKPGDQVKVELDNSGVAQSVVATYGEVRGSVKSVGRLASGNRVVTLDDGTTVEIFKDAPVTMEDQPIDFRDIKSGEDVVIRTNPENNLGFGVAVVTGNNDHPTPPDGRHEHGEANVSSFVQDANGPLRAGDVLTARLSGTPGGSAMFAIPGVVDNVPMQEKSPGVYIGSYSVPGNVSVNGAAVLGKLQVGASTAPVIQASGSVTIDSVPPKVVEYSPGSDAVVDSNLPQIYGTISDQGGLGIDPSRVQVFLDGTDVTDKATVTPAFFNLQSHDPLLEGRHTMIVNLQDRAGNKSRTEWSFKVDPRNVVKEFSSDADGRGPLSDGAHVRFTLRAQPGGQANFTIGSLVRNVPMQETDPGTYIGSFNVHNGQDIKDAPVTATFVDRAGNTVITALHSGISIASGPPEAPIITSPTDGSRIGNALSIKGTAAPDTTVTVKVDYVNKVLGGLVSMNGSVGTKEVKADGHGYWEADDIPLQSNSLLESAGNTIYTIAATAQNSSGETSDTAKITVRP